MLFWRHSLWATFFAWTAPFTSGYHHVVIFYLCSSHRVVSVHIPEQQITLQLPFIFQISCAFREFSEQGWYLNWEGLPYIFFCQGLLFCSVGPRSPARLCALCCFFKTIVGDHQADSSASHLTRTSNTDWNKSAETQGGDNGAGTLGTALPHFYIETWLKRCIILLRISVFSSQTSCMWEKNCECLRM